MTPIKSIRAKCLWCAGGSSDYVKNCPDEDRCALWPYRLGVTPTTKPNPSRKLFSQDRFTFEINPTEHLTALKACRAFCIDCSENMGDITDCKLKCAIHDYRMGHNPKLKGKRKISTALEKLNATRQCNAST